MRSEAESFGFGADLWASINAPMGSAFNAVGGGASGGSDGCASATEHVRSSAMTDSDDVSRDCILRRFPVKALMLTYRA